MRKAVFLLLGLMPPFVLAQDTRGVIAGTITDPQGASISGALVTVTNTGTSSSVKVPTNSSGYYEAPFLLPGNYSVSVEFAGFKRSVRTGITLGIGEQLQVSLAMEVGGTTESVTVSAEAPMLDTSSVSTGRSMTNREVMELPVLGNNVMALTRVAPGVQVPGTTQFLVQGQVGGGSAYYAPGNVGGNEWSLDGASTNGTDRRVSVMPSPDIIDEFKIETSNFDASFGHATGLGISMSTKSGANALHGTGTFQYINQQWNAASFFVKQGYYQQIAAARAAGNIALADELASRPMLPPGTTKNYQATISGPVYIPKVFDGRNKLFFFLGFNELKNRQSARPSEVNYTVPTAAMRAGDFSPLLQVPNPGRYIVYDPLTTRPDLARPGHVVRTPFPGNIIPPDRIRNPMYKFYADRMPLPNNDPTDPTREPLNNYLATAMPNTVDYRSWNNRIDYQLNEEHRFFFRWLKSDFLEGAQDYTFETELGLMNWDEKRPAFTAAADWTYAINPTTIFNVTVDTNWFLVQNQRLGTRKYKPSDVGLPAYMDVKCGTSCVLPRVVFPGMPAWSGDMVMGVQVDPGQKGRQQAVKSNLTKILGAHSIRAGVDIRQHFRTQLQNGGLTSGNFSFANTYVRRDEDGFTPAAGLGLSWAAFMLGMPNEMSVDTNDTFALMSPYYGWYGQDTWRVSRTVTLNFGLRVEYERGATERYNRALSYFDPNIELPISAAAQAAYARNPIAELPASQFIVRGGSVYAGQNGVPRELWRSQLMWLPRISAAWQVTPKTVIRAGYGSYYDTLNVMNQAADQYGYARRTNTVLTNNFGQTWNAGDPANGIPPVADPFPVRAQDGTRFDVPLRDALGPMARVGQGFTFTGYNREHPRVQRWRAGIQQELSNSMMIEVAYWGQYGDKIITARRLDALPGQYWNSSNTRNNAVASNMDQQVPNPFHISNFASIQNSDPVLYQHMTTLAQFTQPTIAKNRLLRPFPHMGQLINSADTSGSTRTHALEVNFQRRFSSGFNLNASYTRMLQEDRTIFENEFDAAPSVYWPSNAGRPHRFTATGIYELPFGKGRAFFQEGILNHILGGWQIAATYEFQNGPLLAWNNNFYRGDIGTFEQDATSTPRTLEQWFNTGVPFERVAANQPANYQTRIFPRFFNGLRADGLNQWNGNIVRNFRLSERFRLQIRADALNLQNRSQMGNPDVNPFSTNFGRITSQTSSLNRFYQLQARIQF